MKKTRKSFTFVLLALSVLTLESFGLQHEVQAEQSGETYAWDSTTSLPVPREQFTAVAHNGFIYAVGGDNGTNNQGFNTIYYAPISADGTVGAWIQDTDSPIPIGRHRHSSVIVNDRLYVIGGNAAGGPQVTVFSAPINADGSLGAFNTHTPLPEGRRRHASWVVNGYIFVAGGSNTGFDTVYAGRSGEGGQIDAWSLNAYRMPGKRYFHSSVLHNDYAYVIGGNDETGAVRDTVFYAKINTDGTTQQWQTSSRPLPVPLAIHSSFTANGYLYVVGGHTGSGVAQPNIYYAKLNADGSTGEWQTSARSLPSAKMFHATTTYGDYAYVVGGDTDINFGGATADVYMVSTKPLVNFTSSVLPDGSVENPYSHTLSVADGTAPYSFSVIAGSLPAGLNLNATSGIIQGTPTAKSTYGFTVRVTDAAGFYTDQQFTLRIIADSDDDGIDDAEEKAGPLGSDINSDGIPDYLQSSVVTRLNQDTGKYMSFVVNGCPGGFSQFAHHSEVSLGKADTAYAYPFGLQGLTVQCGAPGVTATFTQYFDTLYDSKGWQYRKLIPSGYKDFTEHVTLGTATVNGVAVTTATFSITDGGLFDADGAVNGAIVDPIGIALPEGILAPTGMSMYVMTGVSLGMMVSSAICIAVMWRASGRPS